MSTIGLNKKTWVYKMLLWSVLINSMTGCAYNDKAAIPISHPNVHKPDHLKPKPTLGKPSDPDYSKPKSIQDKPQHDCPYGFMHC